MLLNSKYSNFVLKFPQNWLYPEVEERYKIFLKRLPIPYRTCNDFINYTVQSITWPSLEAESVQQTIRQKRMYVKEGRNDNMQVFQNFKSGFNMPLSASKDFQVIFRTTEGFLNYWILHDHFEKFMDYGPDDDIFLPDIQLQILDQQGYLMMARIYHKCIMTSISELDLSYSSNVPEYRTFSVSFMHNGYTIKRELQ